MAIIPLRAYNREIEGLIDNGQLDEAVAHCRHILVTFPKHIATYRLLGKAHLEQQRISDATDIFQRVLSAIPDDFIANVGMSIIREDENNLDAAIWHMELAYEAQPSNVAIQDELRRLYGRRDGVQPLKVRLTRGALARMYSKGGLIEQAVAELRSAVLEDPNRPDLQILLAQMYFQSSQRIEAVETAANIIKKLPFCLSANQILAACLPATESSDTRKNYRQLAISMDPYFAFADLEAISSDQVPDSAVNIEKFEWKPGLQAAEPVDQPTWATSLGISLEKPSEDKIPEWLKQSEGPLPDESSEKQQANVSPFIWDTQEVEKIITETPEPEAEIPDWMKAAGWEPSSGETTQEEPEVAPEPPVRQDLPLEGTPESEVPDWLRGITAEGTPEEKSPGSQPDEKENSIPWLEMHEPGPSDSIIQWLEEKKPETPLFPTPTEESQPGASEEEVPDWLKDLDIPYPSSMIPDRQPAEGTPAFIPGTASFLEEPSVEPSEPAEAETPPMDETPPQGEEFGPVEEETITAPIQETPEPEEMPAMDLEELPDWIKELAGDTPSAASTVKIDEGIKEEIPPGDEAGPFSESPSIPEETPAVDFLETTEELPQEEIISATPQKPLELAEPVEELPVLETPTTPEETQVVNEQIVPEEAVQLEQPVDIPSETSETGKPDWLEGLVEQSTPIEEELVSPGGEGESESLDWMPLEGEQLLEELQPETGSEAQESPALPAEGIPEWIQGLKEVTEEAGIVETPDEEAPAQPAQEIPDWIRGLGEITDDGGLAETPAQTDSVEPSEEEPPALPAEEIPDWIRALADTPEESAVDETPVEAPALPAEEIPDWIKAQGEALEEPGLVETPLEAASFESLEEEAPALPAEEIPEWIKGPDEASEAPASVETPGEEAPALPAEEIPGWIKGPDESPEAPESVEIPGEEAPALPAESIPDWIKGPVEHPEEEAQAEPVSENMPEPDIEVPEEVPSWMLELEQPAEEGAPETTTPEALQWGEEELPDWIKELSETPPPESPKTAELLAEETAVIPEPVAEIKPEVGQITEPVEPEPIETPLPEELPMAEEVSTEPVIAVSPVEEEAAQITGMDEELLEVAEISAEIQPVEQIEEQSAEVLEIELPTLEEARNAIDLEMTSQAAELYTQLLKRNLHLEEVLKDLQELIYRFPVDVNLMIALGDAYFRTDDLQQALNSYNKAEELVR